MDLPTAETMRQYADILEMAKYEVRPDGRKYLLPNGEPTKAAIAALRYCAELAEQPKHRIVAGGPPCPRCGFMIVQRERSPLVFEDDT